MMYLIAIIVEERKRADNEQTLVMTRTTAAPFYLQSGEVRSARCLESSVPASTAFSGPASAFSATEMCGV